MWVEIVILSKRLKHLSLITSTKRCVSKTVVKPLHFLRAKEGSLNLKSLLLHNAAYLAMQNSYLFIMTHILLRKIHTFS